MRSWRRFEQDDQGVATTIGAILVAGLVLSLYVTVQVYYVPVWEKEAEAEHMQDVSQRLGDVRALLDASGDARSLGGSQSLSLSPDAPFLSTGTGHHSMEFRPGALDLELEGVGFLEIPDGSQDMLDEAWEPIPSQVTEVMSVQSLRFRFDEVGGTDQAEEAATFTVYDPNRTLIGSFEVHHEREPPERHLYITTRDADGNILYSNPEDVFISHSVSPYWVDALEYKYRFRGLIERAEKPLDIEVSGDLDGMFAINYENTTGYHGPSPGAGFGIGADLGVDESCGSLVYNGRNTEYLQQDLVMEHGALVLDQADGDVFKTPPLFSVRENPEWTTIDVGLHCLVGEPASHSSDQVGIEFVRQDLRAAWGFAEDLHVNVSTEYPDLWIDHWSQVLDRAGLDAGTNYTLQYDPSDDLVRFHLWGAQQGETDIRLNLIHTLHQVTIRS